MFLSTGEGRFLKIARVTVWRMAWVGQPEVRETRESVRTDTGHWRWRRGEREAVQNRQTAGLGNQMVGDRQRKVKDDDIVHTKDSANN